MAEPKYVIKKEQTEGFVLTYQPKAIDLELQDAAKSYLQHQAEKKSDFKLSELIAKQTGVADIESEAYRARVEEDVLARLKEVQENAYREAFELGKKEGADRAFTSKTAELEALLQDFSTSIQNIQTLRTEILKAKEAELIELVFLIGKKIALRDLKEDSSVVKDLVVRLVDEAESDEEVKIHLSMEDFEFVNGQMEAGNLKFKDSTKVKLVSDEKLTSGGCVVQTQFGSIDSQVEVRLDQAWSAIAGRLPRSESKP